MKTLTDIKITVTGEDITICGKVKDLPFNGMLVTRVSHTHINPVNPKHPRRVQSSNEAVFVEAPGGKFAIPNDVLRDIASAAAPETSFAPVFKRCSTPCCVDVISETPHTHQWQVSDDAFPEAPTPHTPPPAAIWTAIDGETKCELDESKVKIGQWVRCVVTNATGTTISQPAKKQ